MLFGSLKSQPTVLLLLLEYLENLWVSLAPLGLLAELTFSIGG